MILVVAAAFIVVIVSGASRSTEKIPHPPLPLRGALLTSKTWRQPQQQREKNLSAGNSPLANEAPATPPPPSSTSQSNCLERST